MRRYFLALWIAIGIVFVIFECSSTADPAQRARAYLEARGFDAAAAHEITNRGQLPPDFVEIYLERGPHDYRICYVFADRPYCSGIAHELERLVREQRLRRRTDMDAVRWTQIVVAFGGGSWMNADRAEGVPGARAPAVRRDPSGALTLVYDSNRVGSYGRIGELTRHTVTISPADAVAFRAEELAWPKRAPTPQEQTALDELATQPGTDPGGGLEAMTFNTVLPRDIAEVYVRYADSKVIGHHCVVANNRAYCSGMPGAFDRLVRDPALVGRTDLTAALWARIAAVLMTDANVDTAHPPTLTRTPDGFELVLVTHSELPRTRKMWTITVARATATFRIDDI